MIPLRKVQCSGNSLQSDKLSVNLRTISISYDNDGGDEVCGCTPVRADFLKILDVRFDDVASVSIATDGASLTLCRR